MTHDGFKRTGPTPVSPFLNVQFRSPDQQFHFDAAEATTNKEK